MEFTSDVLLQIVSEAPCKTAKSQLIEGKVIKLTFTGLTVDWLM